MGVIFNVPQPQGYGVKAMHYKALGCSFLIIDYVNATPPKDCAPQHYEVFLPSPAAPTCKDVCQSFLPLANYPVNVCCPNIPSLVMVSYPILLGLDLSTLWHLLWLNLRLRQWTWPKLYRWEVEEPVFLLTPNPILCLLQTKGWRNATGKMV